MKNIMLILLALTISLSLNAQAFSVPMDGWSMKKETTVIKKDGTKIVGIARNLKRKKGLVKAVVIKTDDGKIEIPSGEIASMYLPPNKLEQFGKKSSISNKIKISKGDIDDSILEGGKTYWEQQVVTLKKGEETLLLQLLNPSFSKDISVYYDPFAKETLAPSVAGVKVAGGDAKSYYVKVEGKPAFRIKKKDYDDMVEELFGDCAVVEKIGSKKLKWTEFAQHIYAYSTECKVD